MIFVDTGGWYASEVEDDLNHSKATEFLRGVGANLHGIPITTDHILDETLTLLRARRGLGSATRFMDKLRKSRSVGIVWVDQGIFQRAFALFQGSKTRAWSFTDCTSFVMMEDLQISEAFGFDSHFSEAGLSLRP